MEIEYPDRDAAFDAYAEAMGISFEEAKSAVLNENQLESALARPQNAAAYEGADLPSRNHDPTQVRPLPATAPAVASRSG